LKEIGVIPDFVVGNSLGEFSAAAVAGIWTKETALEAAVEQAKSITRSGIEGGMLTIIDTAYEEMAHLLEGKEIYRASENFPLNFTLSGNKTHLNQLEKKLTDFDIQYIRLPVNIPFHSPMIDAGKSDFLYNSIFCQTGKAIESRFVSGVSASEMDMVAHGYFWEVICQSSNFNRVVQFFEAQGPCLYLDAGPSGTMATFVTYNLLKDSNSLIHRIMTPFRQEHKQLEQLSSLLAQ
jgi:bacillaene synthase trans-acting acyltransferase